MQTSVTIEEYSPRSRTREVPGFRFFDGRFPSRSALPTHYHDRASIFVIAEGALVERMPGVTFECGAGTLLAKPAGERHSDEVSARGARAIAIEFIAEEEFHRWRPLSLNSVVHDETPRALALALQIAAEMRLGDSAAQLGLEGLALELAGHVLRLHRGAVEHQKPTWLARLHDLLCDGAPGPLPGIKQLGAEFGRHPSHLARAFRQHYGCSIGTFVRRERLKWAARELGRSCTPISTIAVRAGFFDQSHFTRAFRRFARVTPLAYRAQVRGASQSRRPRVD